MGIKSLTIILVSAVKWECQTGKICLIKLKIDYQKEIVTTQKLFIIITFEVYIVFKLEF